MFGDGWVEKDDVNAFLTSFRLRDHTACEAGHLPEFFDGADYRTTRLQDNEIALSARGSRLRARLRRAGEDRDRAKVRDREPQSVRAGLALHARRVCSPDGTRFET